MMTRSTGAVRHGFVAALEPDYAVPPGETLRERLEELGMTQAELATRTGLTPKHINQVLQGVVPLSGEVAQRLEYAVKVPARLWNRLEADYRTQQVRLAQERAQAEDPEAVPWLASLPVAVLAAEGAIPAHPTDTASRVRQLLEFFGVANIAAWRELWRKPAAAFRQSYAYEALPGALAAWLRMGELAARQESPGSFSSAKVRRLLPELVQLTRRSPGEALAVARRELAAAGVVVVLVPDVPGARAYGATRWLGSFAVIQLSLRGKTEDVLWVTLFHELGHVLLHGRKGLFIEQDDADTPDGQPQVASGADEAITQEREAQQFALDTLFGEKGLARLDQITSTTEALDLADELGIGSAIVASQLQARGVWTHAHGARHRRTLPSLEEMRNPAPAPRPRPSKQERGGGAPRQR
ncbi:helix-turn-helix domain-containing protein [Streptomyces rugosispiralis]|uniref:Helix-turn-helix domain-containing protein n=1 Tax=Streptomyces rugosispiralis TaxID=2967341 RepID=A0ABT1VDV0_9ACTN|nr:helix-turn-helix domain-containing protein [Streptomyces rugosispiralis]MCQ8195472.1 helix-turn-helix domain-containing protein [Streptomyces rugosispiralis]